MTDSFEVLDIGEIGAGLRIEIDAGVGCIRDGGAVPDTDFYLKPPLTTEEHEILLKKVGIRSELGQLTLTAFERTDHWLRFSADGKPSQKHQELGIELAKEIITMKGLRAGKVVSAIEGVTSHKIVLAPEILDEDQLALYAHARFSTDYLEYFDRNPAVDWVMVGNDTGIIFGGGTDDQMPEEDAFAELEFSVGEKVHIFGPGMLIGDEGQIL